MIDGKRLIMACSNNYLGLAQDPRVREAAAEAARRWGASTCGSRLLNGTLTLHDELDHRLAKFLGKEAAVSFSTGLRDQPGDHLVARAPARHRSSPTGWSTPRSSRASTPATARPSGSATTTWRTWSGSSPAAPDDAGKLIVVDGVYSMEGDLANLPRIVELKKKYGARLMVDEAHGFGVMGEHGRGTGEHFGLHDDVDLVMATFSKSLASIGGVIAGPADAINWIRHKARALVFSASMTPPAAAAALKALDIIEQEPERRARLWDISERVHRELRLMGFDTQPSVTPVVPIVVGEQLTNFRFWRKLTDAGMFVSPVTKPAVEKDLVRAVFMATHTDDADRPRARDVPALRARGGDHPVPAAPHAGRGEDGPARRDGLLLSARGRDDPRRSAGRRAGSRSRTYSEQRRAARAPPVRRGRDDHLACASTRTRRI